MFCVLGRELTNPVPLIVQPRAIPLAAVLISCSTYSMAGTVLIYLPIIFCINFSSILIEFNLLLGMLELVILPLHVELWQEVQVEIGCLHFRVLTKPFEFPDNFVDACSFLLMNQQVQSWAQIGNVIGAFDVCLQCRQCLCDLFDIEVDGLPLGDLCK